MYKLINKLLQVFGKPHLVEFDYHDASGMHHGRCYVRHLFGGEQQVRRLMTSFGYTNVHIV